MGTFYRLTTFTRYLIITIAAIQGSLVYSQDCDVARRDILGKWHDAVVQQCRFLTSSIPGAPPTPHNLATPLARLTNQLEAMHNAIQSNPSISATFTNEQIPQIHCPKRIEPNQCRHRQADSTSQALNRLLNSNHSTHLIIEQANNQGIHINSIAEFESDFSDSFTFMLTATTLIHGCNQPIRFRNQQFAVGNTQLTTYLRYRDNRLLSDRGGLRNAEFNEAHQINPDNSAGPSISEFITSELPESCRNQILAPATESASSPANEQ